MLLDGDLAAAEPKKLRYRLLHTAARIVHGQRRTKIKIDAGWPWAAHSPTLPPPRRDPTTPAGLITSGHDHPLPEDQEHRTPGRTPHHAPTPTNQPASQMIMKRRRTQTLMKDGG